MELNDGHVSMLLNMGFHLEDVQRALAFARNDLQEAVAILTDDHPTTRYTSLYETPVDTGTSMYGPPALINASELNTEKSNNVINEEQLEFPLVNLYELESRVYTDTWSIPYKREESLSKCLMAAVSYAKKGICESDPNCHRFMLRCMPEAFNKLLTSNVVHRWPGEVQEGIYEMLQMLVQLILIRLQSDPIPLELINLLATVFDSESEFCLKNKDRFSEKSQHWEEVFGDGIFAVRPLHKDPHGWLTDLINHFAELQGFEIIKARLEQNSSDISIMNALFSVFSKCSEFLNPEAVQPYLCEGIVSAVEFAKKLEDFKEKKVGNVCDMLMSLKMISLNLCRDLIPELDQLRADITLKMLKSNHFNARMNGIKEVTRMIQETKCNRMSRLAMSQEEVTDWIVNKRVLSIALEGSIDKSQYCGHIKDIVDYLGPRLLNEEIAKIWTKQSGENSVVVDNIHNIINAAAAKFSTEQFQYLVSLIDETWKRECSFMREKLIKLIGRIGRECDNQSILLKVLEFLWGISHLPDLKLALLERALMEHLSIINESMSTREPAKKLYIHKCIEDIKEGRLILPALKHLTEIVKGIGKSNSHKAEKELLQEINNNHDIIGLVTESLSKCHSVVSEDCRLSETAHQNYVKTHLEFLQFILSAGCFYFPWNRCRELWKTLMDDPLATLWDKETCFEWFSKGIKDFEQETQSLIFQRELLTLKTQYLSRAGFECFKCFFEEVNANMNKLKKVNSGIMVDNSDLVGLTFLWDICLSMQDDSIAESAINMLLSVSYVNLAPKFKRNQDLDGLHQKFIKIWYTWLDKVKCFFEKRFGDNQGFDVHQSHRSAALLGIERLLMVAERYVVSVEEFFGGCRSLPPHGATFWGQSFKLRVACDNTKNEFYVLVHRNETVESLKQKIARELKVNSDILQFNEKKFNKEQKRLYQLELQDDQTLNVRILSSSVTSISQDLSTFSGRHSMDLEHERMLPGVIMCSGGEIFQTMCQLVAFDHPRITNKARQLLRLIPTDPRILQSFEAIHSQTASAASSDRQDLIRSKVLSSPLKQKNQMELISKNQMELPSFDIISKQILNTKATLLPSEGCSSSPATESSDSTILPPIKESHLPSSCLIIHDAPASATFELSSTRTPKDILASLLSRSDTSMFQVLYNLEVLSSKLMPMNEVDATSLKATESFCQNFLEADGLRLIVSIVRKDLPSSEADYETKQACYDICLQLLRFLLCGNIGMDACLITPSSSSSSYVNHSVTFGPSYGPASKIVMKMEQEEFSSLISCFMRVAWTAATGKLQVVDQVVNKDSAISVDMRSMSNQCLNSGLSTGSTESGLSSCSEFESPANRASPNSSLHSTSREKYIACEALELFVTCLRLKPAFIEVFYRLPCISDFIIELLVTSPHEGVRVKAMEQFYKLSQMNSSIDWVNNNVVDSDVDDNPSRGTSQETENPSKAPKPHSPHQFILAILTKARLPFWVPSANIRSINYRLLKQSMQYFALLSQLLSKLTSCMQTQLQLDVNKMLEDEVKWLDNFACLENSTHAESHNILLAGHLQIVRTLLVCEGVDKRKYGSLLIHDILFKFLFPEAKMILDCSMSPDSENNLSNLTAKCSMSESRIAAYDLLVELATGDVENMRMICKELVSVHHATPHSEMTNQWEYMPPVDGRNPCGYVGLKNGGATCYMNSLIQQIFMTPGIAEHILGIDDDNIFDDSILFQIQQVLGHLLDSKLQYYIPEGFWNIFRLWGTQINIREQQDVLDFFQSLIDQLDEQLNKLGREQIFKKTFQGLYSDQKICHSCKHRFEQEEAFFALNVTVKNATLQDSLDQFVKGEILDGDNAYNCEKCGIKRDTTKRLCVKLLPPVLCIQLKRFDYDWEANRAIKFDDHFKFPLVLDMEPYTAEGMAWREEQLLLIEEGSDSDSQMTPIKFTSEEDCSSDDPAMEIEPAEIVDSMQKRPLPRNVNSSFCRPSNHVNYELVGVVVHSGQANAGHYYSFIKERRGSYATNSNKGKWFKFNDTTVEEFEMSEANLESECFGGKYKSKASDSSSYQFPEERQRYWNAYLLFYEKVEDIKTPVSAKKSKVSSMTYKTVSEKSVLCRRQDSLKQLTDLVHKGEKRGLFGNKMPTRVQQMVQAENLQFVKNRNIFELQYFNFIQRLTSANLYTTNSGDKSELNELSLKLACNFLFNTYYRTNFKLRIDMIRWENMLIQIINQSEETCRWMIEFLSRDLDLIKLFLLDCPSKEIRSSFGRYLETVMSCFYRYEGSSVGNNADNFDRLIDSLAYFLNKDVSVNFRQSHEYFQVLFKYAKLNFLSFCHLVNKNVFMKLLEFLLGPLNMGDQVTSRRWGPLQSKDFGLLHSTLAILIIHSDVFPYRSHGPKSRWSASATSYSPVMVTESFHSSMPPDMASFIFGDSASRYLNEVVMALREVTSGIEYILDMLCHCSFNNKSFSFNILSKIFIQCVTAPSNELKHIFQALLQMLLLPDEIQHERLIFIMEEVRDEKLHSNKGLLTLIRQYHNISDSKRSYHFIKFLVNLSSSCILAKEYLLTVSSQWEWAVRWLESKMSENCWSVQTNMSNEETVSHSFQRTISAQDTLAGATALLTEIDQQEFPDYRMDSSPPSSASIVKLSRHDDDVDDDGNQAASSMAQESSTSCNFLNELPSGGSLDDLF